jgi:hypothetical protein
MDENRRGWEGGLIFKEEGFFNNEAEEPYHVLVHRFTA